MYSWLKVDVECLYFNHFSKLEDKRNLGPSGCFSSIASTYQVIIKLKILEGANDPHTQI